MARVESNINSLQYSCMCLLCVPNASCDSVWKHARTQRTLSQRTQFKYRYVWIGEKNSNLRCSAASAAVQQLQNGERREIDAETGMNAACLWHIFHQNIHFVDKIKKKNKGKKNASNVQRTSDPTKTFCTTESSVDAAVWRLETNVNTSEKQINRHVYLRRTQEFIQIRRRREQKCDAYGECSSWIRRVCVARWRWWLTQNIRQTMRTQATKRPYKTHTHTHTFAGAEQRKKEWKNEQKIII